MTDNLWDWADVAAVGVLAARELHISVTQAFWAASCKGHPCSFTHGHIAASIRYGAEMAEREPRDIPWDALQNDQFYQYQEARANDNERLHIETKAKLESAERERDEALARVRELEGKLRDEEESHAALQSRCYEGFATATDGIFDALNELEPLAKAYREIGEAHSERRRQDRMCNATGISLEQRDQLFEEKWETMETKRKLLDRAAEFAKKEGG